MRCMLTLVTIICLCLLLSCTSPPSDGEWQGKLDFKFPIPVPLHVKFTVTDRGRTVRNLNVAGQDINGVFKIEGREFMATATNGATIRGKFDGQKGVALLERRRILKKSRILPNLPITEGGLRVRYRLQTISYYEEATLYGSLRCSSQAGSG